MSQLALYLFGAPRLERGGITVHFDRRKALALLAYLALNRRAQRRETLAALFWPELDQAHAHAALRRTLVAIKQGAGSDCLAVDRQVVTLGDDIELWVDVARFHELLDAQQRHQHPHDRLCSLCLEMLSEAAALYTGAFMAGFTLPDSPDFDEWQREVGESLRGELSGALERLVQGYAARGDIEEAIGHAQRWLALDPLCEEAYRHMMRLYARCGRRTAAIACYQTCQDVMAKELGLAPILETVQLYRDICENRVWPSPPSPEMPSCQLSAQATPFIGRRAELAAVVERLACADCRLLTLVGPGGIGKTRLALEAAAAQAGCFVHGVYLVPLAFVHSTASIIPAIAQAIGLEFSQAAEEGQGAALSAHLSPQAQLLDYLWGKQMLLVLDNMEHLIQGEDLLSRLLTHAREIKIMVTSRERLNLRQEWLFEVPGMQVPAEGTMDGGEAACGDAPQLFIETARRITPDFRAEMEHVAQICRRLGGMPLAIELAASWARVLSCAEMIHEIERTFAGERADLLSSPLVDLPARHRSMRAVFDPSWNMLSQTEQAALAAMSVFRGSVSRVAAREVAGASLNVLTALVDKSWLRPLSPSHDSGDMRYAPHELVRHYAWDRLEGQRRVADVRDRHTRFYAAFLDRQAKLLRGPGQSQALDAIELEIEDVGAAWEWALERGQRREVGQLLEGLYLFYTTRSRLQEGQLALQAAVAALEKEGSRRKDPLLGRTLSRLGWISYQLHELEAAETLLQESLAVLPVDDATEIAQTLLWLGDVAWRQRQHGSADVLLQKSLTLTETDRENPESRHLAAQVLCRMADRAAARQDDPGAERLYRQGLDILQDLGDPLGMTAPLLGLAALASWRMQWWEAERLIQESLAIRRQMGDRRGTAWCLHSMAEVKRGQARYAEARELYEQSLALYRELGDLQRVLNLLDRLSTILYWLADYPALHITHQESHALALEFGDPFIRACALEALGQSAHLQGNYAEARAYYTESLRIGQEIEHPRVIAWSLVGLADIDLVNGQYAAARAGYEKGLHISQAKRVADGIPMCLVRLTDVTCTTGDDAASRGYLVEALCFEMDRGPAGAVVHVLSYAPLLLAKQGQVEEALALCSFLLQRPELRHPDIERMGRLFNELIVELSPETVASIQEQNRGKTLDGMSQTTLALLSKN